MSTKCALTLLTDRSFLSHQICPCIIYFLIFKCVSPILHSSYLILFIPCANEAVLSEVNKKKY